MLLSASRAISQVFQEPFRAVLWKMIGFTLAVLMGIWIALQALVAGLVDMPYPWLETALSILTGIGAIFALSFLIAPVSAVFAGLFQDQIAAIVEAEDYAAQPPGAPLPIGQAAGQTLKFTGVVIAGNIVALILLLVPGVNLIAFFLVNGYLLGREFFEFAAMRYSTPADARAFRHQNAGTVFLAGMIIAGLLMIPVLNLVTPVFATIFMVHLVKKMGVTRGDTATASA